MLNSIDSSDHVRGRVANPDQYVMSSKMGGPTHSFSLAKWLRRQYGWLLYKQTMRKQKQQLRQLCQSWIHYTWEVLLILGESLQSQL